MARMQSGKEVVQFDLMTDNMSKEKIHALEQGVSACATVDMVTQQHQEVEESIAKIRSEVWALTIQGCHINEDISQLRQLMTAFLKSKFVRFLNFFGRWFIYGVDGNVYLNNPENEHMRPTRRFFHRKDESESDP